MENHLTVAREGVNSGLTSCQYHGQTEMSGSKASNQRPVGQEFKPVTPGLEV